MNTLFLITARGGSKGIPGKNIKYLAGKPLIYYTIDAAKKLTTDENICVSTDSQEIIDVVEKYPLKVPFIRPTHLATDTAGSYEVILHALDFYKQNNKTFDQLVLLQPTSPFRNSQHIQEALALYTSDLDMVVSVKESHANPYYNLFEEDTAGFLKKCNDSNAIRRQDSPKVYEYNGAIYIINIKSVMQKSLGEFKKIKKYIMDDLHSVDIDSPIDWLFAEMLLEKKLISI